MDYRNFKWHIVIRILLIFLTGFVGMFFLLKTNDWSVSIWMGIFTLLLIIELIRYNEKSRKDLSTFLDAIQQNDFTNLSYLQKTKKYDLAHAYNAILETFQKLRGEKEAQHQYLDMIVEHVKVALICFDEDYNIFLSNKTAKNLFKRPILTHLKQLVFVDNMLADKIKDLKSDQKTLLSVAIHDERLSLSLHATEFKLKSNKYKLISFQDIRSELDEQEVASWQKLIRVITHEIINSVLPISNLSSFLIESLNDINGNTIKQLGESEIEKIKQNLSIIDARSKGLSNFVGATKSFTHLKKANITSVNISELVNGIRKLLDPKLAEKNIRLEILDSSESLTISADQELIEQVLINLILNAIDAMEKTKQPRIQISYFKNKNDKVHLEIKDNGNGMKQEIQDKIFVPFFTTKEEGSGIGLSLSKQIMHMHNGTIMVHSEAGRGTVFTLQF